MIASSVAAARNAQAASFKAGFQIEGRFMAAAAPPESSAAAVLSCPGWGSPAKKKRYLALQLTIKGRHRDHTFTLHAAAKPKQQ